MFDNVPPKHYITIFMISYNVKGEVKVRIRSAACILARFDLILVDPSSSDVAIAEYGA